MATRIGLEAKLYRLPGPVEMENVRNVTLSVESSQADVSTRGSGGWRQVRGALKDGTLDFEMLAVDADADLDAVSDAFFNNTTIELKVMSGALTGDANSRGLHATFSVVSFARAEDLEDAQVYSVSLKPAPGTTPAWIEGTA